MACAVGKNDGGVQAIVEDATNLGSVATAGFTEFVFRGPGFSDSSAVRVSVNLSGVVDSSTLAAAIRDGSSWSGRERNGAFLNLGDAGFVDVAGISGFDFVDDARSAATVDWNHDGRLDVWVKNRSGPQLRFLENDVETPHSYVSLKLQGVRANRDAAITFEEWL